MNIKKIINELYKIENEIQNLIIELKELKNVQ